MFEHLAIVTIDGPAGSGKSTVSRMLANSLGFLYLDTGAMYRAVAWACIQAGVDTGDADEVGRIIQDMDIVLKPSDHPDDDVQVYLNSREIGGLIRTPEIGMEASRVSSLPVVRGKLTLLQQEMGKTGNLVAEGRDTGTVVFPQASWKFYLDATPEKRAERRIKQLRENGELIKDNKVILNQIIQRDRADQQRATAPLKVARDAVVIDATELDAGEIAKRMLMIIGKQGTMCI